MSISVFLKSKRASIIIGLLIAISIITIAKVCGCPPDALGLMSAIAIVGGIVILVVGFNREKRFYNDISELSQKLEHPYQLHSLIEEPSLPEHKIVFEALQTMGASCADEVAQANAQMRENRDYVEGWVHGVKTPLAACELVAERASEPERSQLRHELDRIDRQVERALWHARSDSTNLDYTIRKVSLAAIVNDVCRSNARFLIENGCTPVVNIASDLQVLTDEKQLSFVISQAVENAAKYGASRIEFTTKQETSQAGTQQITLSISDNGQGIPASDISHVFDRGFTGTRGREKSTSTGMGLYLAARICKKMGLGLSISSEEDIGTTVCIVFTQDARLLEIQSDMDESLA